MKFFTLLFFMISFGQLFSQNVYIPDPVFKDKLLESSPSNTTAKNLQGAYFAIDANGDGEIQVSEAIQVSSLDFYSTYYDRILSIIGIESFANLAYLDFSNNAYIEKIELTNFQYLAEIKVAPCESLTKLVITDNPSLTEINFECADCVLVLDELDTLDCSGNNLSTLNLESGGTFSDTPPLKYLDFSNNHVSSFNFETFGGNYLDISGNEFTGIEIHGLIYPAKIFFYDNPLVTLDLHASGVDTLIINNFPLLEYIDVSGYYDYSNYQLNDLRLSGLPSLEYLNCANNNFTHLILSDLPALSSFDFEGIEMDLTLEKLPSIINLDFEDFRLINNLTISELDNITNIKVEYEHDDNFSGFVINNMDNLSVIDFESYTNAFAITNCPSLDTVFYRNFEIVPDLIFNDLPELKYLRLQGRTQDSTYHLTNLPSLDYFSTTYPVIDSLQLINLPELSTIFIMGASDLTSLNIFNLADLKSLEIVDTRHIPELILENLPLQVFKYHNTQGYYEFDEKELILENLPQLDSVYIHGLGITALDFNDLPNLHSIELWDLHRVQPLTFAELPELHSLKINSCWLDTLIVSGFEKLEDLVVYQTNQEWALYYDTLRKFEVTNLPALKYLDITENAIPSDLVINVTGFPKLHTFKFKQSNDQLFMADLPSLTNLFMITGTESDSIVFDGFPSLQTFYGDLRGSYHNLFQLSNMPLLEQVSILMNDGEIDLSGCPSMDVLNLNVYYPLNFLNLKNGSSSLSSFYTDDIIDAICVDSEAEADLLKSFEPDLISTNFTTDCETQPCPINKITGTILYDLVNTDCLNSGIPCANTKVTISGSHPFETFTDSTGSFEFITQLLNENIVITPVFENEYFIANPSVTTVAFDAYGNEFLADFCISAENEHNDLEVIFSSAESPRPGFDLDCNIDFKNKGTAPADGTINLYHDDEVMDIVSVYPPYDSYTNNCVSWNYTSLNPFEMRNISITFNLNSPIENPPLNGGDILEFKAEILPVDNDEKPDDNTFLIHQEVVNSFDPNDKICQEGTALNLEKVGEYVHYLIRFENTGTAEAINITVRDVIDTTKFNINSFVFLNSSHACECKITEGNNIEFVFKGIYLSHIGADNNGFINFKIKTLASLELNDVFANRAMIYFDFNAPVYTDNCETVVLLNVNTQEIPVWDHSPIIYPNPVHDILNIMSETTVTRVEIYNLNGRLLKVYSGNNSIPMHNLMKGLYLVKVYNGLKSAVFKVVKL